MTAAARVPVASMTARLGVWRIVSVITALALSPAAPAGATAAERWDVLQSLPRVAVHVTVSPNHPELSAAEARRRIEEALRRAEPAPAVDPASADRLHLLVAVRSYSSADLRGYYLPLSRAYGIGPVRLALERQAQVPGLPEPVAAQVWQAERQAKGPWGSSAAEILELVDEVVAAFVADYRRALGR